ncbi:MAG: DNA-binding protein [Erysipelotrichaceae bacterium]|nr:DNA-binding protein [Erysipelotrichaceae bacterium]
MPLDREKNSLLLDYYGVLLTRHQQDILDEYFNEDLSMNEIADNLQISKSAVQDLIKRSLTQLNEFEKKLKLIARDQKLNYILEEMKKQDDKKITDFANKIEKIK